MPAVGRSSQQTLTVTSAASSATKCLEELLSFKVEGKGWKSKSTGGSSECPLGSAALAPTVQMRWRWPAHLEHCLRESLAQAGASLYLKEVLFTDGGRRKSRKSGLNKDKWSISDLFTLLELSRVEWDVLCGQSYHSEQGGNQEIGKKNKTKQNRQLKESLREEMVSELLPSGLSGPEGREEVPRVIYYRMILLLAAHYLTASLTVEATSSSHVLHI